MALLSSIATKLLNPETRSRK